MILLSAIIRQFEAELLARYQDSLLPSHLKALAAMKDCRTSASPSMLAQCTDCEHQVLVPHSCGHRSCPHCQHHESQQWLERQLQRRVPATYFLVTFTLPPPLRALAFSEQRTLYTLMMQCAWQTVHDFAHNDSQLHGTPGAIAVLHTHSRRLDYHPHVHLVDPAAAVDAKSRLWRSKKSKGKHRYLFHHKALAKVFRAKLLAAISAEGLPLPPRYPEQWVVDCKCVGSGEKALVYLGRYLYRGVIRECVRERAGELSLSRRQEQPRRDADAPGGEVLVADPAACLAQRLPSRAQLRLPASQQQAADRLASVRQGQCSHVDFHHRLRRGESISRVITFVARWAKLAGL